MFFSDNGPMKGTLVIIPAAQQTYTEIKPVL